MTNLEYLEKLKKDNFREFVTESGDYREHIEGRKVIALEIIAEELCKLNLTENVKIVIPKEQKVAIERLYKKNQELADDKKEATND